MCSPSIDQAILLSWHTKNACLIKGVDACQNYYKRLLITTSVNRPQGYISFHAQPS